MTYPQPLAFVRHGETAWNASRRYQGTTETKISNQGKQQCFENSKLLSRLNDHWGMELKNVRLVTSPLQRSRQSAQIIASELGVNPNAIVVENAFREIAMGRWQGFNSAQVKDRFHLERKSRKFNRWEFAPQGGESLAGRAAELQRAVQNLEPYSIVITHAGILRILTHLLGGIPKQQAAGAALPHVGIYSLQSDKWHTLRM